MSRSDSMVLSFIHPLTCGFAKGIGWQVAKKVDVEIKCQENESRQEHQTRQMQERFDRFSVVFATCKENFAIDFKSFRKVLPDLRKKFSGWNRRKMHERNQYTGAFNIESWNALSLAQQGEHTLQDCKACRNRFSNIQSLFPVKAIRFIGSTHKEKSLSSAIEEVVQDFQSPFNKPKGTQRQAVAKARDIYKQLDPFFHKDYGVYFSKAFSKCNELNLGAKKSKAEKKRERRNQYRRAKQNTEEQWESTSLMRYL